MPADDFLQSRLQKRREQNALRSLVLREGWADFCSNDYLGLAASASFRERLWIAAGEQKLSHGSGGSRLLAGNYRLAEETERQIADFHDAAAALIFNSGYDANTGFFSAVPQRGDVVFYDELIHASIHDGMRLSLARSFPFAHNDMADLEKKMQKQEGRKFVATESVFSMDGDMAALPELVTLCKKYGAHLVVDEAHATGVVGAKGEGAVQSLQLQDDCFARIHTFGKGVGVHGAAILGSETLKQYLVNFARSFVYTTALPPASVAAIRTAYETFPSMEKERRQLAKLIRIFRQATLPFEKLQSETPIQGVIVPGNEAVKEVAAALQKEKLDVRPVLSPTVPQGRERLRIVLHSFNSEEELMTLLRILTEAIG